MLFHAGSLLALEQENILRNMDLISSVSGGSIINAQLALEWNTLYSKNVKEDKGLNDLVILPIQKLATHTIDVPSVMAGLASPLHSRTGVLSIEYNRYLFHKKMFSAISSFNDIDKFPTFIFNTTNLSAGRRWYFSNTFSGGWPYGYYYRIDAPIADIVAASSALPPAFKSIDFSLANAQSTKLIDMKEIDPMSGFAADAIGDHLYLVDGGLAGNKGLDTCGAATGLTFVSDASVLPLYDAAKNLDTLRLSIISSNIVYARAERNESIAVKPKDEAEHAINLFFGKLIADAPSPRPTEITNGFNRFDQLIYWIEFRKYLNKINADLYPLDDQVKLDLDKVDEIMCFAMQPTRLAKLNDVEQRSLINFGYLSTISALEWHRITTSTSEADTRLSLIKFPREIEPLKIKNKACDERRLDWIRKYLSAERTDARYNIELLGRKYNQ